MTYNKHHKLGKHDKLGKTQGSKKTNRPVAPKPTIKKHASKGPFDRNLVRRRRGRAQKQFRAMGGDRFLCTRCADDAVERVLDVQRNFERTLIFGDKDLASRVASGLQQKIGYVVYADHTTFCTGLDIVCDEEALPFKPESFDLIINLLTLQGVNQVPQALARMKSMLKPDGFLTAAFFGGETLNTLRYALYEVEDKIYGRVSPRISSMIRLEQATSILSASGLTMPVADRDSVAVSYKSLSRLYADLRLMGESNIMAERVSAPVSRRFFNLVNDVYGRIGSDASGKYQVRFEIIWLTGWAPHPDQPKPLKPGSGKMKLADALGVAEKSYNL